MHQSDYQQRANHPNEREARIQSVDTEDLAMNAVVRQLISRYHGYVYASAGVICAFFSDSRDAHACAEQLRVLVDGLQILGSQLTFVA